MILTSIKLEHFRSFDSADFSFDKQLTFIVGENSVGKTNLLEGIYFICTGKGLKDEKLEDLIAFNEDVSDVKAGFIDSNNTLDLRIHMKRDKSIEKTYLVDNAKKTFLTYRKFTPACVVFSPELISIIDGQPSLRRRFVDDTVSCIDQEYRKRLRNYENALRRRNKILEKESDQSKLKEELAFWNNYLIEQAEYIVEKRRWLCSKIESGTAIVTHNFSLEYVENVISKARFEEYFMREYYQKRTLIGIQRDDFRVSVSYPKRKSIDVHVYASRGEQRLALFWLIVNQLGIYHRITKQKPLVILDDIFSELDIKNREVVTKVISEYQTIITTTEKDDTLVDFKKSIIAL